MSHIYEPSYEECDADRKIVADRYPGARAGAAAGPSQSDRPPPVPRGDGLALVRQAQPTKTDSEASQKFTIVIVSIIVICIGQIVGILVLSVRNNSQPQQVPQENQQTGDSGSSSTTAASTPVSCKALREQRNLTDGIYTIKPSNEHDEMEVYCDMTTDGGGWTLVASIHEEDITKKCHVDDYWSKYIPDNKLDSSTVKTNWENKMVFGDVRKCTKQDYKNAGFFTLAASDVMAWHVPKDTLIDGIRSDSILRYRTTNGFLDSKRKNLGTMYNDLFPLAPKAGVKHRFQTRVDRIVTAWKERKVEDVFTQNHKIYYPAQKGVMSSTPFSSASNQIQFTGEGCSVTVAEYEKRYTSCTDEYTVFNSTTQYSGRSIERFPFIAAAVISNEGGKTSSFGIWMNLYFASGAVWTKLPELKGDWRKENYTLEYHVTAFHRTSIPIVWQYFFTVSNHQEWGSSNTSSSLTITGTTPNFITTYKVENNPTNVVMGYIFILQEPARTTAMTPTEANEVADKILDTFIYDSRLADLFRENPEFSVPVKFDGPNDIGYFEKRIPPSMRPQTDAGYMQFRAYNYHGYTTAFCPGVRVKSLVPEYVCIGGVSSNIATNGGTCGDFAGWAGKEADSVTYDEPIGYAHAQADSRNVILLFLR